MGCHASRVDIQAEAASEKLVWDLYNRGEVLGKGGYGEVLVVRQIDTQKEYAMKVIEKSRTVDKGALFQTEVDVMKQLSHENVIKFVSSHEDEGHYYLVSDLYTGGELFDHIVENHHFSEKIASSIVHDVLMGMQHCHSQNIVHLDIKPENLVLKSQDPNSKVVLIDFGCARKVEPGKKYRDRVGTPYYVAPQMLEHNFEKSVEILKACDMWSIGIITFVMVTGRPPFSGSDNSRIYARIRRGEFKYPKEQDLSDELKDLISKLLCKDSKERLTVDEALRHPWVQGTEVNSEPIDSTVLDSLRHFQKHSRLKKAIAHMLANSLTEKDALVIKRKFVELDHDQSGALETGEVVKLLNSYGYKGDQAEKGAASLIQDVDLDNDGVINESEFRAVAVRGQLSTNEAKVRETFDALDANKDGSLTVEEVSNYLKSHAAGSEIEQMFKEADENHDGKITYQEFLKAMMDT